MDPSHFVLRLLQRSHAVPLFRPELGTRFGPVGADCGRD